MKKAMTVLCVVVAGLLLMGAAPSIRSYQETFRMEADGSGRVAARVELSGLSPGAWEVPLTTWRSAGAVTWNGVPDGVKVQPALGEHLPCLRLTVEQGAPAGFVLELAYQVPAPKPAAKAKNLQAGETSLAFRFLNGGKLPVADYGLKVLLPEGKMVHSIQEKTPKGKSGDGAQVAIVREDGRRGVVLAAENIAFGDTAGIRLIAVDERRSPGVTIILGLGAVAYLVVFRDIVKPPA